MTFKFQQEEIIKQIFGIFRYCNVCILKAHLEFVFSFLFVNVKWTVASIKKAYANQFSGLNS